MFSAAKTAAPTSSGYTLSRSLRFRSSASAYLSRTPSVSGSLTTWTWSSWVKRGTLGSAQTIFGRDQNGGSQNFAQLNFNSSDQLDFINYSTTTDNVKTSNAVYRDPSAWYHIVCVFDTTNATSANRIRLYVNGQQITSFSSSTDPSLNYNGFINQSGYQHDISSILVSSRGNYIDGYLAEVNFIDGQALSPTSFGAFNSTTGVWQPIKYTGTYGTNGFYLNFNNNASTTTLGYDTSGNGNNWTTNNISLTAGTTYDSMTDVPTLTSATAANYPVFNPVAGAVSTATYTISQGNLYMVLTSSSNDVEVPATMQLPTSGKWYWEINVVSVNTTYGYPCAIGISDQGGIGNSSIFVNNYYYYLSKSGNKFSNGTSTSYGSSFTNGDVIGVAFDAGAGTLTFYKNNTSQGTAYTGLTAGPYYPKVASNDGCTVSANFGQQGFTYTPPTGFVALNTYNLPTPTIVNGASYMAATTYTGTGNTTQVVANSGNNNIAISFKPDLVWVKGRSTAYSHHLTDSVRGVSKDLASNSTNAENNYAPYGTSAFNSNGFSVTDNATGDYGCNGSGTTFVAWQWQAGAGTTSSNTNGSITSTVSVNATAGFSVVTFNIGSAGASTVGHGLGVAPSLIIAKDRTSSGGWPVFFSGVTTQNQYLTLNNTTAVTSASGIWGSNLPTSTVFGVTSNVTFGNNDNCVAYCWAPVAGFSKFGSYTGNGSTDGTFVYTGFRPRFVMIKDTTNAQPWIIVDTSRNTYNVGGDYLEPNSSNAEDGGSSVSTATAMDIVSNGFKLRNSASSSGYTNASGDVYIYAAFAENPFRNSLAR